MIAASGEQIEIAHGEQRAVIVEVGGGLRTYTAAGDALLDGYGAEEMSSSGRGQVLIPWPNRIQDGSYTLRRRAPSAPDRRRRRAGCDPRPRPMGGLDGRRARAAPGRHGAQAARQARLPVLAPAGHRVPALGGRPAGADHRHQPRGGTVPVRERRPSVPDRRGGDGGLGRSSVLPGRRCSAPTSAASRSAPSPSTAPSATSAGRGRSARPGSTTPSRTSSATRTASPASRSATRTTGARSRSGSTRATRI